MFFFPIRFVIVLLVGRQKCQDQSSTRLGQAIENPDQLSGNHVVSIGRYPDIKKCGTGFKLQRMQEIMVASDGNVPEICQTFIEHPRSQWIAAQG